MIRLPRGTISIQKRSLMIRKANHPFIRPGDRYFSKERVSIRDYDLSPVYSRKPCGHVLVDDVLIKIFSLLDLKSAVYATGGK